MELFWKINEANQLFFLVNICQPSVNQLANVELINPLPIKLGLEVTILAT
jgi:hypothetical protein